MGREIAATLLVPASSSKMHAPVRFLRVSFGSRPAGALPARRLANRRPDLAAPGKVPMRPQALTPAVGLRDTPAGRAPDERYSIQTKSRALVGCPGDF